MSNFYKEIYSRVKSIPKGCVTNYGTVALKAGHPRAARVVGTALAHCNEKDVPCHRVVQKDGGLPGSFGIGGQDYQRFLLSEEGITFLPDGKVDMKKHFYSF